MCPLYRTPLRHAHEFLLRYFFLTHKSFCVYMIFLVSEFWAAGWFSELCGSRNHWRHSGDNIEPLEFPIARHQYYTLPSQSSSSSPSLYQDHIHNFVPVLPHLISHNPYPTHLLKAGPQS